MIQKTPFHQRFLGTFLAGLSATLSTSAAYAIDLQPGEVKAPSPGLNVGMASYQVSERGDLFANGHKISSQTQVNASQLQLRYSHTFLTGDMPSVFYVQTPMGYTHPGKALANRYSDQSGVGDTSLVYAIWPVANRETQRYLGVAAYLTLPTGQYDHNNAPLNVGAHRYTYALQAGFEVPLANDLHWMVAGDTVWFGDNDAYGRLKQTLRQDALYTSQTALSYEFGGRYTVAAAYLYTTGGETSLDHVDRNDRNELARYQLTASVKSSVGKFVLQYGSDIHTQNGFFEDSRLILRYITLF